MTRVLIIDDKKRIRDAYRILLEKMDCLVDVAQGSLEGIDCFISKIYDVVLTDFKLDELDGLQMLEFFQTIDSKIPVVFYSDIADGNTIKKILEKGAFDFVPHSAGTRFLLHIISKAVYERPHQVSDDTPFCNSQINVSLTRNSKTLCD